MVAVVVLATLVVGLQTLSGSSVEQADGHDDPSREQARGGNARGVVVARSQTDRSVADARWVGNLLAETPRTRARAVASADHDFVENDRGWLIGDGERAERTGTGTPFDLSADVAKILRAAASWQENGADRAGPVGLVEDAGALGPIPENVIAHRAPPGSQLLEDAPIAIGEATDATQAASNLAPASPTSPPPNALPMPDEPVEPPQPVGPGPSGDAELSSTDPSPESSESDALLGAAAAEALSMVSMVNQARAEAGLPPLIVDVAMGSVAQAHSEDMAVGGYFSHTNGAGLDPFDRMRAAGILFRGAGENISRNGSTAAAHAGLIDSPGHRANILNERFTRIGIGVYVAGPNTIFFTQLFAY
jgi:uncharacterized protein YkwD